MKRRMSIEHLDEKKEKSSEQLVTTFYFHVMTCCLICPQSTISSPYV